jgi:hypothetical protein
VRQIEVSSFKKVQKAVKSASLIPTESRDFDIVGILRHVDQPHMAASVVET